MTGPTACPCGAAITQPLRGGRRKYCSECVIVRGRQRALAYFRRGLRKKGRAGSNNGGGRKKTPPVTQELLHRLLSYNPSTGVAVWLGNYGRAHAGDLAGSRHTDPNKGYTGYIAIGIGGRQYLMHRLIWFYVHGCWPANQIDHINGVKSDNRLANLREATVAENGRNVGPRLRNKSGFKGVTRADTKAEKWQATIFVNGRQKHLGLYLTREEASAAYQAAATKYFGQFARAA